LIIDASETNCGASGQSFWGVNTDAAEYLVFGKRSFIEGFYSRPQAKLAAITFGGDYLRLLQFKVLYEIIQKENLIDRVKKTSTYMRQGIEQAS